MGRVFTPQALIVMLTTPLLFTACLPEWISSSPDSDSQYAPSVPSLQETYRYSSKLHIRQGKTVAAEVVRVLDGDTIEVDIEGELLLVGYIGVKAPEFEHPRIGTEPFGREALERNRQLMEGRTVHLEEGVFSIDRAGRHLRYVYVDDVMVNGVLIFEGLAQTDNVALALKYGDVIYALQNEAMYSRKGGWRDTWQNLVPTR